MEAAIDRKQKHAAALVLAPEHESSDHLRRALNVVVAFFGIVVTAPMMVVIGIAIRLNSRGPILYTQPRIGMDRRALRGGGNSRRLIDLKGKPFCIYKFRTMQVQNTADEAFDWASEDDPRVTVVGAFLRKFRLDELPQLFNVLKGDMNIVGPRPEQPRIVQDLDEQIVGYQTRHWVRPGITGWAQINQAYDTSVGDVRRKLAFDLEYIASRSALSDLRIMLRTVPVMLFRRGSV